MKEKHGFQISTQDVADFLKAIVNSRCEKGFVWFPDVKKPSVSILDLLSAIEILEKVPDKRIAISEERDGEGLRMAIKPEMED